MVERVDIARSLVPRRASLGDGHVFVDPPTVRVAFQAIALAVADDRDRFVRVLSSWMPPQLIEQLFEMGPTQRTMVLREMLFQGSEGEELPDPVETAKKVEDEAGHERKVKLTIDDVWFEYCAYWRLDPFGAMDMPFPFFLRTVARTYRLRARDMIRDIEVASAPHYTQEARSSLLASLRKQAGITQNRSGEEGTEEDWERDREALRNRIQGMG